MWTACRGAGGRAQAAPPRTPRGLQSRGRRAWPREAACVPPMRSWHAPRGRGQRGPLPGGRTHLHPPGRGRPCPSSDASWTCPLCRGQGGDVCASTGASSHARGPSQRRRTQLPQPRRTSAGAAHPAAECGHAPHRSQPAGASGLGPRGWGPSAPPAVSEESGERTAALPCRPGPRSRWQVCPRSLPASLLRREGSPPEGRPAPTLAGAAAAPLLAGACPSPAVPVSATLGGCELATSAQEE